MTMPDHPSRQSSKLRGSAASKTGLARIAEIFRRFEAANPHPEGELRYKNPYTLLVAVVLSAQATDTGVNKATGALFAAADKPEKMLMLGEEKLRAMIKTIGLYRAKAKNVIALSGGSSRILAGRFHKAARRSKCSPALAARPPMWS